MITRIRKVRVGNEYYVPSIKCNVIVSELFGYDYCFGNFNTTDIITTNQKLHSELGDDFRALYYQAVVLISKSYRLKKNREYQRGDTEVLEWSDLQDVQAPKK